MLHANASLYATPFDLRGHPYSTYASMKGGWIYEILLMYYSMCATQGWWCKTRPFAYTYHMDEPLERTQMFLRSKVLRSDRPTKVTVVATATEKKPRRRRHGNAVRMATTNQTMSSSVKLLLDDSRLERLLGRSWQQTMTGQRTCRRT